MKVQSRISPSGRDWNFLLAHLCFLFDYDMNVQCACAAFTIIADLVPLLLPPFGAAWNDSPPPIRMHRVCTACSECMHGKKCFVPFASCRTCWSPPPRRRTWSVEKYKRARCEKLVHRQFEQARRQLHTWILFAWPWRSSGKIVIRSTGKILHFCGGEKGLGLPQIPMAWR